MKNKYNSDTEINRRNSAVDRGEAEEPEYHAANSFVAPFTDGDGGEYVPRHLAGDFRTQARGKYDFNALNRTHGTRAADSVSEPYSQRQEGYIPLPDGRNIAPNGAVIRNPWSEQPEIRPDNEYTPEKEDLNLLIM